MKYNIINNISTHPIIWRILEILQNNVSLSAEQVFTVPSPSPSDGNPGNPGLEFEEFEEFEEFLARVIFLLILQNKI